MTAKQALCRVLAGPLVALDDACRHDWSWLCGLVCRVEVVSQQPPAWELAALLLRDVEAQA